MSGPGKIFSLALESEFSVPHSYLDPPQFSAIYSCLSLLLVLLSLVSVLLFLQGVPYVYGQNSNRSRAETAGVRTKHFMSK